MSGPAWADPGSPGWDAIVSWITYLRLPPDQRDEAGDRLIAEQVATLIATPERAGDSLALAVGIAATLAAAFAERTGTDLLSGMAVEVKRTAD